MYCTEVNLIRLAAGGNLDKQFINGSAARDTHKGWREYLRIAKIDEI